MYAKGVKLALVASLIASKEDLPEKGHISCFVHPKSQRRKLGIRLTHKEQCVYILINSSEGLD